jgi:general secretion pathway protein F
MPRFSYKARDSAGQAVESSVDAPTRKDAVRLLSARGLSVAAVAEASGAPAQKAAPGARAAKAPAPAAETAAGLRGDLAPRRSDRLPFL